MPSDLSEREIRIGTSGWHYKHWIGTFYPSKTPASKMLVYYCQHFDTVELNNTFYRLPLKSGLDNWRESTPSNFLFAAKGSRFLTHMKKLRDPEPGLAKYFERVEVLGGKLGPILFQLPPHWELDIDRLAAFVEALPTYHRYAFEFRNASWDTPEVYGLLNRHNIGYCIFDLAGTQSPVMVTSNFAYVRLHGPGGRYQGKYTDEALGKWAQQIVVWQRSLQGIYVYFDNDEAGYAAHDALRLKEMVSLR
jgi:uncharacterized protein YecE (DUF72 family)